MMMKQYITLMVPLFFLAACQQAEQQQIPKRTQVHDLCDDDRDGVVNTRDICADSPSDGLIDNQGCASWGLKTSSEDFVFSFEFDKAVIQNDDVMLLQQIADSFKEHPDASIVIVGDTSSEGTEQYNHKLGQRRADAVMSGLKEYGVDESTVVEYVYSDEPVTGVMKKRERRTIVRIVYVARTHDAKWDIYTIENQRDEK